MEVGTTATSGKNDASKGFLGRLRNAFEEAMVSEERSSRVYYKKAQMGQPDRYPEEEWETNWNNPDRFYRMEDIIEIIETMENMEIL